MKVEEDDFAPSSIYRSRGRAYRFRRRPVPSDHRALPGPMLSPADDGYIYQPRTYLPLDDEGVAIGLVAEVELSSLSSAARAWVNKSAA